MSAAAFADGIATLLASDATLQSELATLLGYGVTRVLRSNRPWTQIPTDQWPCWIIEQGDGVAASMTNGGDNSAGLSIGHARQSFQSELDIALLWSDPDRDSAADARGELPALIARLLMRNPAPGGIGLAYLTRWIPDQGINHPKQVWNCSLLGEYTIKRS